MKQRGYICGIAWQHELAPDIHNSVAVYTSVDELKRMHHCTEECGIVEIEMREVRWVKVQNLERKEREGVDAQFKFHGASLDKLKAELATLRERLAKGGA